jgi:hypothetical protein
MKKLWQIVGTGITATSVFAALTVGAYGDIGVAGSGFSWGPGGAGTMQIRGHVLCAGCSLEEAHQVNPGEPILYQPHRQGQLVMTVTWVSAPNRWSRVVWPARLWVRGEEKLLQQLNAEANLFKELKISGILSNTRTLDITAVTIRG